MMKALLTLMLLTVSSVTQARYFWVEDYATYQANLSLFGKQASYSEHIYAQPSHMSGLVETSQRPFRLLAETISLTLYNSLKDKSYYRSNYSWVDGRMRLALVGRGSYSDLNITLPNIQGEVNVRQWGFDCRIDYSLRDLQVNAKVDLVSGTVYDVLPIQQPNLRVNCSSALPVFMISDIVASVGSWVVNKLIDRGMGNLVNIAGLKIAQAQFAGLNETIPSGRFITSGTDIGAYLKSNLASFIYNSTFEFEINKISELGTPYTMGLYETHAQTLLKLSIPNKWLSLQVSKVGQYRSEYECLAHEICGEHWQ